MSLGERKTHRTSLQLTRLPLDASLSSKIGVTCETTISATTPLSISTVDDGPSETGTLQIESATSPIMAVDYIGLATPTSVDTLVSPVPPGDLHTMLRQTPLFMSSPPALIDQIAARVRLRHFQSGDSIITEGEQAKAMFIVMKGTVTVCSADGEIEFAELQRGNFFGGRRPHRVCFGNIPLNAL